MDDGGFILGALGIPDHQVGVGSRDDPAFSGIKVVDLGRVGAGDGDEAILVELSSDLEAVKRTSGDGAPSPPHASEMGAAHVPPLSPR